MVVGHAGNPSKETINSRVNLMFSNSSFYGVSSVMLHTTPYVEAKFFMMPGKIPSLLLPLASRSTHRCPRCVSKDAYEIR